MWFACDREMKRIKQKKKKPEIPDDDNNANVETENKTTKWDVCLLFGGWCSKSSLKKRTTAKNQVTLIPINKMHTPVRGGQIKNYPYGLVMHIL